MLAGHWSDHIGRRAALILAVVAGLAGGWIFAQAEGLAALSAGRALQGVAVALATGASAAALRELLPSRPEWASRFTLLASAGGVAAGPVIGGLLSMLPGPTTAPYYVHSVVLAGLLVPLYLLQARPAIMPADGRQAIQGAGAAPAVRVHRGEGRVLARGRRRIPQLFRLWLLPVPGAGLFCPDRAHRLAPRHRRPGRASRWAPRP